MKSSLFFICFFLLLKIYPQQIDFSATFSSSTSKELKNNWGCSLGYNYFLNKNRVGVALQYSSFRTKYDDIYTSTTDGVSKYIEEYEPQNRRIAADLIYSYALVRNEKSNLYFGCNASVNYYHLKGKITRIENGFIQEGTFPYDFRVNNKLGLGFLIEYEIEQIVSDRISTSIKINPELTAFDEWGTTGGYDPWLIGWLNFSIGIKYGLDAEKN